MCPGGGFGILSSLDNRQLPGSMCPTVSISFMCALVRELFLMTGSVGPELGEEDPEAMARSSRNRKRRGCAEIGEKMAEKMKSRGCKWEMEMFKFGASRFIFEAIIT